MNPNPSDQADLIEAIEKIRKKLLDLSSRNRLLNFSFRGNLLIRIAKRPNLDQVFSRLLLERDEITLNYVPKPAPNIIDGKPSKQPDASQHAERLGIETGYDSVRDSKTPPTSLQTLFYPEELEVRLSKIASAARTAIEETGANMLFLIFGFLEFYESDSSESPRFAPLISVPISLNRGKPDLTTGTFQYAISYNDEDLSENRTLKEKLRHDFNLQLPDFEDPESDEKTSRPEIFFERIERIIINKPRWRVLRQLTIGMLAFGKLAMWADLDCIRNPKILESDLLKTLLAGGNGADSSQDFTSDYPVDEHPYADIPLIEDADASQHSAIIDALSGKSLVINGPPGTGKSQTITNIIAAGLAKGLKILFVSEKLAALEVVRARLDKANLGDFCLELHSHKTHKRKFLADIKQRIDKKFSKPSKYEERQRELQNRKTQLNHYAQLIGSCAGNHLNLTVQEILWACERRRQQLGDLASRVEHIAFSDAPEWTKEALDLRRDRLKSLANALEQIGDVPGHHAWRGFLPDSITLNQKSAIAEILAHAIVYADSANKAAEEAQALLNLDQKPTLQGASTIFRILCDLKPYRPTRPSLVAKLFDPAKDPSGTRSGKLIETVSSTVTEARTLIAFASEALAKFPARNLQHNLQFDSLQPLSPAIMQAKISDTLDWATRLDTLAERFKRLLATAGLESTPARPGSAREFLRLFQEVRSEPLATNKIQSAANQAKSLQITIDELFDALRRLQSATKDAGLPFDATPESITTLSDQKQCSGIPANLSIDHADITRARQFCSSPWADRPLSEIKSIKQKIEQEADDCTLALRRFTRLAVLTSLPFDATIESATRICAVVRVAVSAPPDLLEYRHPSFSRPEMAETIQRLKSALNDHRGRESALSKFFNLEILPTSEEAREAARLLRSKSGIIAHLDANWRKAKRLHDQLSREPRKLDNTRRAEELTELARWIEGRSNLLQDGDFVQDFGKLFKGLGTNPEKINRLYGWYQSSREILAHYPGLLQKIDLNHLPADTIAELAAKFKECATDLRRLEAFASQDQSSLGLHIRQDSGTPANRLTDSIKRIQEISAQLGVLLDFFKERADAGLPPRQAIRRMELKCALDAMAADIERMKNGRSLLLSALGVELRDRVDFDSGDWPNTLAQAQHIVDAVKAVSSLAADLLPDGMTLASTAEFAEHWSTLEKSLRELAPETVFNERQTWSDLAEHAKHSAAQVKNQLGPLAEHAKPHITTSDAVLAVHRLAKAWEMMDQLSASESIAETLAEAFNKESTNLQELEDAHTWGSRVRVSHLPHQIKTLLTGHSATEIFDQALETLGAIEENCRTTQSTMEKIATFGIFSWTEWLGMKHNSDDIQPEAIAHRARFALERLDSIFSWARYVFLRKQACTIPGLESLVKLLEAQVLPPPTSACAFEYTAFQSIAAQLYRNFPLLANFDTLHHESIRDEFRRLDREIIELTGKELGYRISARAKPPKGTTGIRASDYSEKNLIDKEINKQKRHIPIRQLVKRAGRALLEFKPCFMMGPLSVAQYLAYDTLSFDMVIMDEASQLPPENAVGAIIRGAQIVVVGDANQLPPTDFFARTEDSGNDDEPEEEIAATTGMESILDICQQVFKPSRSLTRHYRSQHQSLINFSNHHFYDRRLVIFPSPHAHATDLGVKWQYIEDGIYENEHKRNRNPNEAKAVVKAILGHVICNPQESLGVVTLNQAQSDFITDELNNQIRDSKEFDGFIDKWNREGWPFFIKNLENVQGDERDVIFISTTFGRTAGAQRPRQNFGPISRDTGWRRLNVLFTRAKRRIELFTSMQPEDVIIDEKTPRGTKALQSYLEYAKNGVLAPPKVTTREPDSDFEVSVANAIKSMNFEVCPQLGVAGYFIDIAVRDPDMPGRFLAAIECDGATYHSSKSARERDRIRQEILESMGWKGKIHRIWSTDWFYNPTREIERLRNFLEASRLATNQIGQPTVH